MDAKELRIGNRVVLDTGHTLPMPHMIKAKDIADIENGLPEGVSIEPIAITPEILEKSGFVSIGDEYHFKIPGRGLNIAIDTGDYSFAIYDTDESYRIGRYHASLISNLKLHQLQNLYHALTSEELPIEL